MAEPKRKISGALSEEKFEALARHSRKFGYYASREHVWHLVDTVRDARAEAESWRSTAVDRGNKLVRAVDRLEEVRGQVRTLLVALERGEGTREAAEDLRSFAWPGQTTEERTQIDDGGG